MNLDEYQRKAEKTAIYPKGTGNGTIGLMYCSLGVAGEAGEVADNVKKMMRDDGCVLTPDRRIKIEDEVGDVLWYLANTANELGTSLNAIAEKNLKKLNSRKKRNKLKGSGDTR